MSRRTKKRRGVTKRRYARRRYPSWYRYAPKRIRDGYRRALLRDDNHVSATRWALLGMRSRKYRNARRPSRRKRLWLSKKIRILRREGYPQKQAVAIAYNMLRRRG